MKRFSILVAAAVMGLAALPAMSQAASPHSARVHFRSADAALDDVAKYVASDSARALAALTRDRRATAALRRDARSMRRSARTTKQRVQAAKAYRLLASQQNANVETLSAILAWSGTLQDEVARAISGAVSGRQAAVDVLNVIAPQLPTEVQELIAKAIADYSVDTEAAIAALSNALASGNIVGSVAGLVTTVLDQLTAALTAAVDQLAIVAALLPAELQPVVLAAFGLVKTSVVGATSIIKSVLGSVFGVTGGQTVGGISLPIPFKLPISLPGFGG